MIFLNVSLFIGFTTWFFTFFSDMFIKFFDFPLADSGFTLGQFWLFFVVFRIAWKIIFNTSFIHMGMDYKFSTIPSKVGKGAVHKMKDILGKVE